MKSSDEQKSNSVSVLSGRDARSDERHTAMRWHFSPTHGGQAYDIGADDGSNIALVYGPKDGGPSDFLAKARLIVAAPTMLSALYEALVYFEDREDINYEGDGPNAEMSLATEIRAAIRKAEA